MEVEYKFLYPGKLNMEVTMEIIDSLKKKEDIITSDIVYQNIITKYLDSRSGTLRKDNIAVRERYEKNFVVADEMDFQSMLKNFSAGHFTPDDRLNKQWIHKLSFKWGGSAMGGLHERREVEIDLGDMSPNFDLLDTSLYQKFQNAEKEGLVNLFNTVIDRITLYLKHGGSFIELSVDNGFLVRDEELQDESDKKICKLVGVESGEVLSGIWDSRPDIQRIASHIPDSHSISEVEIELKEGDKADLKDVAEFLAEKFDLIPNDISKYQRGVELYF